MEILLKKHNSNGSSIAKKENNANKIEISVAIKIIVTEHLDANGKYRWKNSNETFVGPPKNEYFILILMMKCPCFATECSIGKP